MLGRLVGWLVILGSFSDILGTFSFIPFFHGLGDPSQLPVGDADADADVALAWGCQCQCIMIDVFEADVFLRLDACFFFSCAFLS